MLKPILTTLLLLIGTAAASAATLHIAAAISMKDALKQIGKTYESTTGNKLELTLGSSGQLAEQIKAGAPVDLFISAASKQMDDLDTAKLIDPTTRKIIATNELVLIQNPKTSTKIDSFQALLKLAKIASGEPKTVPAGMYAGQVFAFYKIDKELADKIIYGTNVRQVLDYVIRGDVDAGVVYASDALTAGDKVIVVAQADAKSHDPIEYPAAVVSASSQKELAIRFIKYLQTEESQKALTATGFTPSPATQPANAPK